MFDPGTFQTNSVRVTWPTVDDFTAWAASEGYGPDTVEPRLLDIVLQAAIDRIAERCCLCVRPVDADGNVDPAGDPVQISGSVHLAVLIQAAKWLQRKDAPSGLVGANEFVGVVRATRLDGDVEALIANKLWWGLA